jgi:Immunity protein 26
MMVARVKYPEGTVFAVPLCEGGFARGIVARVNAKTACVFGYFFGPKLASPFEGDLSEIRPQNAIISMVFGDLGLIKREWQIVGHLPDWNREKWGMPDFVRRDPIGKRAWTVRYSDDDPSLVLGEAPINFDTDLPDNWSWGYGAVELYLTRELG